jgi:hypothetical protein
VVNGSFELQNFHAGAYSLTLRVADAPPAIALASAVLNVNADVRVQLQSEPVSCCLEKWSHSLAVVAADGRFRVDNVRSGDYRISITDLPEGFYLKDARLSERDVSMRLCVPRSNPFSAFAEGRTQ